jgi:hypothetical protein
MLLYDPENSIFEIDGDRMDLAREFRNRPRGPHGVELQRVLDRMRTTPLKGRFVLIVVEPYKTYALARLSGERGKPPMPVDGVTYQSMQEAEWGIFKRRWQELTGKSVDIGEDDA